MDPTERRDWPTQPVTSQGKRPPNARMRKPVIKGKRTRTSQTWQQRPSEGGRQV